MRKAAKLVADGHGTEWMSVPGFIYCKDARVTARAFAAFYTPERRQDTAVLVGELALPVLVLAGTRDVTVTDVIEVFSPLAGGGSRPVRADRPGPRHRIDATGARRLSPVRFR